MTFTLLTLVKAPFSWDAEFFANKRILVKTPFFMTNSSWAWPLYSLQPWAACELKSEHKLDKIPQVKPNLWDLWETVKSCYQSFSSCFPTCCCRVLLTRVQHSSSCMQPHPGRRLWHASSSLLILTPLTLCVAGWPDSLHWCLFCPLRAAQRKQFTVSIVTSVRILEMLQWGNILILKRSLWHKLKAFSWIAFFYCTAWDVLQLSTGCISPLGEVSNVAKSHVTGKTVKRKYCCSVLSINWLVVTYLIMD